MPEEAIMIRSRYLKMWTAGAAALVLSACVAPYQPSDHGGPGESITASPPPTYYRGTESGMAVVSPNDAAINANVVSAVSAVPGMQTSNIQVGTLNGIVTLRGTASSQAAAQSAVQAARQVPGVRSVDYDLQVM
jgi:hyperosmotically inducible protein